MSFVNLHSHSEYSISDGLFSPKAWASAYKERGFKAAALTDHGTMGGLIPFYHAMRAEKMTPILGCEFYFTADPTLKTGENRRSAHIVLLAKNYDGLRNMMALSKLSYTEGFYYKPRIGMEWLTKHSEGLICLTACQGGVLSQQAWKEKDKLEGKDPGLDFVGVGARFEQLRAIFGGDLYVEFQGHVGEGQEFVNKSFMKAISEVAGFQPVVTNDTHYIAPEHAKIQEHLKQMAYKNTDAGQSYTSCDSLWLKNVTEVYDTFRKNHEYLPKKLVAEGLKNTQAIWEKCAGLELPKGKRYLPKFTDKINSHELFTKLCTQKLAKFLKSADLHADRRVYVERFAKEFKVIMKYGLQDYFLIVWDIIRFCRDNGIYTGLGRGSAAGCLISYLLGIVKIDPIEHKLLFERFLNEHRCESGEMPDIDLDIESDRRQEVKDYIFKRYGRDRVCEIGTYGRMKLRTALIDFGKAMKVADQKTLLSITTKLELSKEDHDDLMAALDSSPALMELMVTREDYAQTVESIIGQIKSQSVHPAGVLICSEPIATITPIKTQKSNKDGGDDRVIVTQAEDKHVVAQGLMKVDLLGLKEYDIIKYVIERADTGLRPDTYVERILNLERRKPNAAVWKMFQEGKTEGVFQFASTGMQQLLIDMKPTGINDLIAANALFRPGCLENGWHTLYCRRKHGKERVRYVHSTVEEALSDTFGVVVYQEQFMEVFHKLGGISLVDSDTIRSALGKKDKAKLDKFKAQFVTGASSKVGSDEAAEIWEQLEKAAGYTFNKSHSAAYSVLAYISQYLKVHHPEHFWCAQLEWDTRKNKREDMIFSRKAAAEMGVEFVLPHINRSKKHFDVEMKDGKSQVVWSISGIKGVGPVAANEIIRCQPFKDFDDFYDRVNKAKVKMPNMVGLIVAGAFDEMGDRRELLQHLHALKKKDAPKYSDERLMLAFYESLGFFERSLKKVRGTFSRKVLKENELRQEVSIGDFATVGGMITEARSIRTKKGDLMGFVTLMDLDEIIEVTCFPEVWERHRKLLHVGSIVEIEGNKSAYGGKENLLEAGVIEAR